MQEQPKSKAIKPVKEQDIELREQQVRQYVESLQPYEIKVPDFKLYHGY